ncbi:GPP34 family phosphoprotein [Streptomyces sp. NPDC088812]|uniref:GPP34 family phosphoprotein n=1 Tax=Streptomyces sp. NPDC088812 TaxID=3365905 RepID=UPI003815301F
MATPDEEHAEAADASAVPAPLHETLLLTAYDRLGPSGVRGWRAELGLCLVAAALLDLHAAGRVAVGPHTVRVTDASRAADPVCDHLLERLVLAPRARRAHHWMRVEAEPVLAATIARLTGAGLLRTRRHRLLGVLPVIRYVPTRPAPRETTALAGPLLAAARIPGSWAPVPEGTCAHLVCRELAFAAGTARMQLSLP